MNQNDGHRPLHDRKGGSFLKAVTSKERRGKNHSGKKKKALNRHESIGGAFSRSGGKRATGIESGTLGKLLHKREREKENRSTARVKISR